MKVTDDAVWDMFLAHVTPGEVEAERFRMPPLDERPGSSADRRMRRTHRDTVNDYWFRQRFPNASNLEIRAMVLEAQSYDTDRGYKPDGKRWRNLVDRLNTEKSTT